MAEAVFADKVRAAGLEGRIEVDSAGTGSWHVGRPPHHGTSYLLAKKGIAYSHLARVVSADDFREFDYIVAMDEANVADLSTLGPGSEEVRLFLSYADDCPIKEVPDPYYTGNFEEVYRLVDRAADGLLATIRKEHDL